MIDFLRRSALACAFAGPPQVSIEDWAFRNSKKSTPDGIIAAAIVQSFAKHFEDWTLNGDFENLWGYWQSDVDKLTTTVKNDSKKIRIVFERKLTPEKRNSHIGYLSKIFGGVTVDGHALNPPAARLVLESWLRVSKNVQRLKDTATKAEEAMKRNETAWNLAERLLGMKRNEFGALVPAEGGEDGHR